jgi:hypothetical protein
LDDLDEKGAICPKFSRVGRYVTAD